MTFPVRVVIPTIQSRRKFLEARCLPSVLENDPVEIVVVSSSGDANIKRNVGVRGTIQPFLLFVDDDSTLRPGCIARMLAALATFPTLAYAYSDYNVEVLPGVEYLHKTGLHVSGDFDTDRLRRGNFIHTTSLIRTQLFPGFDPSIRRFQDWDLWLTLAEAARFGAYVNETLFDLWQIDEGTTMKIKDDEAYRVIQRKHRL